MDDTDLNPRRRKRRTSSGSDSDGSDGAPPRPQLQRVHTPTSLPPSQPLQWSSLGSSTFASFADAVLNSDHSNLIDFTQASTWKPLQLLTGLSLLGTHTSLPLPLPTACPRPASAPAGPSPQAAATTPLPPTTQPTLAPPQHHTSLEQLALEPRRSLLRSGYTRLPPPQHLWGPAGAATHARLVSSLAHALTQLRRHGWHLAWILIFDEPWILACMYGAFIGQLSHGRLALDPDFVFFHVDPGSRGWAPHRDRPTMPFLPVAPGQGGAGQPRGAQQGDPGPPAQPLAAPLAHGTSPTAPQPQPAPQCEAHQHTPQPAPYQGGPHHPPPPQQPAPQSPQPQPAPPPQPQLQPQKQPPPMPQPQPLLLPAYVTCWVALTAATPDNGCVYCLPADLDPAYGGGGNSSSDDSCTAAGR